MNTRYLNFAASFGLVFLFVYVLYIGKHLLIPLVIALVFWYIIVRLTDLYQRIPFGRYHLHYGLALTISIITTGVVLYLFFLLLSHSISNIIQEAPKYEKRLQELLDFVNKLFGNHFQIDKLLAQIDLAKLFSRLALIVSDIASNFVLIVIYLLFLLLEHRTFNNKIKRMCKSKVQHGKIKHILDQIDHDIKHYLRIKTAVNAIAGVLSYILLVSFGIQYAEFWGVLIFLLHYIPFIGPIIAIVIVLLAVSVQVTTLVPFIILAVILCIIQFGVGNFLEPKWMGTRLNLSPIVILLSLAFWGAIWGVIGMFLCVPLMVIANIILAKFPKTHPVAVALSAEGEVDSY
ncbi:AI-2E family transporter [Candidiatus Paracoxiella cheracis]|uniref:AI-2E family transporter n=1 Tax=Candidiatus Paracoxiella cheracis TaxID=3405120 RepID=UPI003BF48B7C